MPAVSQAQNRWAHWQATHGTPQQRAVGQEFITNAPNLPPRVQHGVPIPRYRRIGA